MPVIGMEEWYQYSCGLWSSIWDYCLGPMARICLAFKSSYLRLGINLFQVRFGVTFYCSWCISIHSLNVLMGLLACCSFACFWSLFVISVIWRMERKNPELEDKVLVITQGMLEYSFCEFTLPLPSLCSCAEWMLMLTVIWSPSPGRPACSK